MKFEHVLKETSNVSRGGKNLEDGAKSNYVGKCKTGYASNKKFIQSKSPKNLDDITKDDMFGGKNYKKRK